MFLSSLILAVLASLCAAAVSFQLKKAAPDIHASVGATSGTPWWPFWILSLLSPKRWRRLPPGLKAFAVIAASALIAAIALMATLVFRFVIDGGSL